MPRRQPLTRVAAGALACLLTGTALAGCGRSVEVAPAPADPACPALVAALPDRIADLPRKDTSAAGTAAWGDPPIVLRCGVGMPASYTPTSQLLDIDGIAWLSEDTPEGARFTSVRTAPRIEVTVPAAQEPASAALVDIVAALADQATR